VRQRVKLELNNSVACSVAARRFLHFSLFFSIFIFFPNNFRLFYTSLDTVYTLS
jgi:hypothetical protein